MVRNGRTGLSALLLAIGVAFSNRAPVAAQAQPASLRAVRVARAPVFDGTLHDTDWRLAPVLTRFWEIYPADRGMPNEETSARFLYDDRFFYVGIRASLKDPKALRAPFVRHDLVNSSQDYVQVYVDPLGSRRGSYLFRVNARGSRGDSTQDELLQTENSDPDFDWEARAAMDGKGWTAELRIPLSTLRIPRSGTQDWVVMVYRGVPRAQNVQFASSPVPRVSSCFLCYAGTVHFDDLKIGAENLLVTPSIVGTDRTDIGAYGQGSHPKLDPSLDAQWLPYPGGALDVTVHPDFSQTEADAAQLTANERFAIDFPEKRAFFREGSDLITLPLPLIYTRTIVAPNAGLRFTHRSDAINATGLVADDGGNGAIVEPGFLSSSVGEPIDHAVVDFGRVRVSAGNFDFGALVASKQLAGGAYNAIGGFDGSWGRGADRVTGEFVDSRTRNPVDPTLIPDWDGRSFKGIANSLAWDHLGDTWVWQARYAQYDDGFRSWLGYVPRVGYDETYLKVLKPNYPAHGIVNEFSPYVTFDRLRGLRGEGAERDAGAGLEIATPFNGALDVSVHPTATVLNEQGRLANTAYLALDGSINPAPWLPKVALKGKRGSMVDFLTGDRVPGLTYHADVQIRPSDRIALEVQRGATRLGDDPGNGGLRLDETVTELTASYFFGARLYVVADEQFFDTRRRFPIAPRERSSLANVQLTWEASRDLTGYLGVRSGANRDELLANRGGTTEVYLKISRTFRSRV